MRTLLICGFAAVLACSCAPSQTSSAVPAERQQEGRATILETKEGRASYVAAALHGRKTASGVPFDAGAMVAAHPSYPFKTIVRVTELGSGRSVEVQIVDRGPAQGARQEGVIIDLSRAAADALGFVREGRTQVRLEVLRWGPTPAAT
jgi:rare lipoprotein A